jgi:hypothetical protein
MLWECDLCRDIDDGFKHAVQYHELSIIMSCEDDGDDANHLSLEIKMYVDCINDNFKLHHREYYSNKSKKYIIQTSLLTRTESTPKLVSIHHTGIHMVLLTTI